MTAEIDPVALDQIFTFWFPLPPRTAFRGIHELPPGHMMILRDGASTVRRWWQLSYPDGKDAAPSAGFDDQVEELTALLADATRIRLRADVPVGSYLSGGWTPHSFPPLLPRTSARVCAPSRWRSKVLSTTNVSGRRR